MIKEFGEYLEVIEKNKPLVHQITNFVTANDCANTVLAMGGHTVMADCIEEVEEITRTANSLVLNFGVPSVAKIQSLLLAGKIANEKGIPIVFDPVGCGATDFRRNAAQEILREVKISVIRGNLSEIKSLYDTRNEMRGIDTDGDEDRFLAASRLAKKINSIVVITGAKDVVTDGRQNYIVENGCVEMTRITGTGCMCSALAGLFLGADKDNPLLATVYSVACMGIAGERSWRKYRQCGVGHFHMGLLDELGKITKETFEKEARIRVF